MTAVDEISRFCEEALKFQKNYTREQIVDYANQLFMAYVTNSNYNLNFENLLNSIQFTDENPNFFPHSITKHYTGHIIDTHENSEDLNQFLLDNMNNKMIRDKLQFELIDILFKHLDKHEEYYRDNNLSCASILDKFFFLLFKMLFYGHLTNELKECHYSKLTKMEHYEDSVYTTNNHLSYWKQWKSEFLDYDYVHTQTILAYFRVNSRFENSYYSNIIMLSFFNIFFQCFRATWFDKSLIEMIPWTLNYSYVPLDLCVFEMHKRDYFYREYTFWSGILPFDSFTSLYNHIRIPENSKFYDEYSYDNMLQDENKEYSNQESKKIKAYRRFYAEKLLNISNGYSTTLNDQTMNRLTIHLYDGFFGEGKSEKSKEINGNADIIPLEQSDVIRDLYHLLKKNNYSPSLMNYYMPSLYALFSYATILSFNEYFFKTKYEDVQKTFALERSPISNLAFQMQGYISPKEEDDKLNSYIFIYKIILSSIHTLYTHDYNNDIHYLLYNLHKVEIHDMCKDVDFYLNMDIHEYRTMEKDIYKEQKEAKNRMENFLYHYRRIRNDKLKNMMRSYSYYTYE